MSHLNNFQVKFVSKKLIFFIVLDKNGDLELGKLAFHPSMFLRSILYQNLDLSKLNFWTEFRLLE